MCRLRLNVFQERATLLARLLQQRVSPFWVRRSYRYKLILCGILWVASAVLASVGITAMIALLLEFNPMGIGAGLLLTLVGVKGMNGALVLPKGIPLLNDYRAAAARARELGWVVEKPHLLSRLDAWLLNQALTALEISQRRHAALHKALPPADSSGPKRPRF